VLRHRVVGVELRSRFVRLSAPSVPRVCTPLVRSAAPLWRGVAWTTRSRSVLPAVDINRGFIQLNNNITILNTTRGSESIKLLSRIYFQFFIYIYLGVKAKRWEHRRSQGAAREEAIAPRCPRNTFLTKNVPDFTFFCPEPCRGGFMSGVRSAPNDCCEFAKVQAGSIERAEWRSRRLPACTSE